jgi:putative chitinase
MTQLSPHFSLNELTVTNTGLPNAPPPPELANLTETAALMEMVRALLGHAITVNSGYRSPAVNKKVGGVASSDHVKGMAVDFVCPEFGDCYAIAKAIEASNIPFGQLIYEGSWVHISTRPNAQRLLTLQRGGGYARGIVRR